MSTFDVGFLVHHKMYVAEFRSTSNTSGFRYVQPETALYSKPSKIIVIHKFKNHTSRFTVQLSASPPIAPSTASFHRLASVPLVAFVPFHR